MSAPDGDRGLRAEGRWSDEAFANEAVRDQLHIEHYCSPPGSTEPTSFKTPPAQRSYIPSAPYNGENEGPLPCSIRVHSAVVGRRAGWRAAERRRISRPACGGGLVPDPRYRE